MRFMWRRWDTLAVRMFLLMWAALILSHLVAWGVFVWRTPPNSTHAPVATSEARGGPRVPVFPSLPPPPRRADEVDAHPRLPLTDWLLDYGIRWLVIALAAGWGARWLSSPLKRLSQATQRLNRSVLGRSQGDAQVPEEGSREVREAARVFNRMSHELRQRFEERGMMVASISHDLRTPLTRLRLRLENGTMDRQLRDHCARDIANMHAVIDAAMDVFRPPREDAVRVSVDLAALAQAAVDDLAETGARAEFCGGVAVVSADPVPLRRVLDNLLGNAIRYGGQARVWIASDHDAVELWVDDDGPGIPTEDLERVLQPFRRLESSRNPQTGGVGLGLYIAQTLAERQGASLRLRNRVEGGLRVSLRWTPPQTSTPAG